MADNGKASTDPTIAWDDLSGIAFQRFKHTLGADGENVGDQGGVLVDSTKGAAFVRNRPDIRVAQPAITVSTSPAYTAGDCVGGLVTITSVVAVAGNAIRISGLTFSSPVNTGSIDFYLLRDTPGGTYTDNAALTIASGDRDKVVVPWDANMGSVQNGFFWGQIGTANDYLPPFTLVGTSLYLIMDVSGTPTFGTTSDLKVSIFYERL